MRRSRLAALFPTVLLVSAVVGFIIFWVIPVYRIPDWPASVETIQP